MTGTKGDSTSPQAAASSDSSKRSALRLPPETPEAISTRFRVIATFWAVIILLGFPIWWKTTSIYRAHLPIQEMVDWADGKVSLVQLTEDRLILISADVSSRLSPRDPCRRAGDAIA
jgi:hypothetical protein